jgi:chemosensory pili system protein ChpA (sensor histidine kinase/response regulator)
MNRDENAAAPAAQAGNAAEGWLETLERLTGQAEQEGLQGLQDVCLLLAEALGERMADEATLDARFLELLGQWPALATAYCQRAPASAAAIIQFVSQPELTLPLAADEIALLEAMLKQEAGEAEADLAGEDIPVAQMQAMRQARLQALPKKARELLELLLLQAEVVAPCLQALASGAPPQEEDQQEALEQLNRFANAATMIGAGGLAGSIEFAAANLKAMLAELPPCGPQRLGLLQAWLAQARYYLLAPDSSAAGAKLLTLLEHPLWPLPLEGEAAKAMQAQLCGMDPSAWGEEEDARAQTATLADVALTLPEDVNEELLGILLQELPLQARQFAQAVQHLRTGGSLQDLATAQRIAHTLKGAANTVGIKGIAVLTHQLEDILLACANESQLPGPRLASLLLEAGDCLENMSDALLGLGEPPAEAQAVLQAVLDWANRIDHGGLAAAEQAAPAAEPPESGPAQSQDPPPSPEAPAPSPAAGARPSGAWLDALFRLCGESIILNAQAQERLRRAKSQWLAAQAELERLRQLGAELEALIDLRDLSSHALGHADPGFDALEMDQYNELHSAGRRMAEAAVDAREFSLDAWKELELLGAALESQHGLAIDSQDSVAQARLSPVASLFPRLQRSLRQTCRLTGKKADLSLAGGQLMIDSDILNALADPLMHLLRNAVDHGIETEAERLSLGKPPQGRLAFSFESDGAAVLARCSDDGRGLDLDAIRAAAEKRGWLAPGQDIPQAELERFILRPNFSSRLESTQTSGRGVGMDAVRAQAAALGGALALSSAPGKGMAVEMRIPLPLSRSHALLAQAGPYQVAISHQGVSQILYLGAGELIEVAGERRLMLEDTAYPVATLNELLRLGPSREQPAHSTVLLVQCERQLMAVLASAILDSRDIVIKPLSPYLARIPGIMGATILGDGAVAAVIDLPELLRAPILAGQGWDSAEEELAAPSLPAVLVVDDSLSNRRALEQLLADAGFQVRLARDGVEAAEQMARDRPDIVLTDLEMPRMNGLELAAHIRAQPDGKTLPIIMITSRTTQRHRQLAAAAGIDFYLAKPVLEDDLLDKINGLLASARQAAEA